MNSSARQRKVNKMTITYAYKIKSLSFHPDDSFSYKLKIKTHQGDIVNVEIRRKDINNFEAQIRNILKDLEHLAQEDLK